MRRFARRKGKKILISESSLEPNRNFKDPFPNPPLTEELMTTAEGVRISATVLALLVATK
jgi:hypothetical protein